MDFLQSIPVIGPIVPLLIGAAVLWFVWNAVAPRLNLPSLDVESLKARFSGGGTSPAARAQREATRERRAGNYLMAGKLYEDAGELQQALDCYLEGEEWNAAGFVSEQMPGRSEKAADLFLKGGDWKKAASVFEKTGKPGRAAALYEEKNNNLDAARLYAAASSFAKAAELYVKSGYPLKAGECFEKNGEALRAAECFEQHFMENVAFATTYSSTAASTDSKYAQVAGKLYEQAGLAEKAREIYVRGFYFSDAARVSMSLGQFAKAAEQFLRAENLEGAADAFEKAGDAPKAANYRGEIAFKAGRQAEAAAFFQRARDFGRSAELFEQLGMAGEAARAYEEGESFSAAGGCYLRAGLKSEAASCFERSGEYETAAKLREELGDEAGAAALYEKAGQTFKSGLAAAKAGQQQKAIALLQRVTPADEQYLQATEQLAELFLRGGMAGLAVERLRKVLAGPVPPGGALDLHYLEALACEVAGSKAEAIAIYKKVLSENFQFRDAARRVQALEAGQSLPLPFAAAAPATGPAPAAKVPAAPAPAPAAAPPPAKAPSPSSPAVAVSAAKAPAASPAPAAKPAAPAGPPLAPAAVKAPAAPPAAAARPAAPAPSPAPAAAKLPAAVPAPAAASTVPPQPPPAPAPPALAPGLATIPPGGKQRFVPGPEIGRGPLGVVRGGTDLTTAKPVAIRQLAQHDAALVADLKAAAAVSHPNVARILGFVDIEGQRCLVTELVQGASLTAALQNGKRLAPAQVLGIGRVVAQALGAIHAKGLAHGSVQPSNLVSVAGSLRLTDVGLGRLHQAVVKSSPYRAPESRLDATGDLYALGALLYHALTGAPPAAGATPPPPSAKVAGLSAALDAIVLRCLAQDPAQRVASAEALLGELQAAR